MKKMSNKFWGFVIALAAVSVLLMPTQAQAAEKKFKAGTLYSDGDVIDFTNVTYFKYEGTLWRVKGPLSIKGTGIKAEKSYGCEFCLKSSDTVVEYYSKTFRGTYVWISLEKEYTISVILDGENYPKGLIFTDGNGTEEKPYKLVASSSSVEVEVPEEKDMTKKMTAKQTSSKTTLTWNKVKSAASYEVYVAYEGKNYSDDPTVTVKKNKATVKKLNGKKISLKKNLSIKILAKDKKGDVLEEIEITVIGKKNKAYKAGSNIVVK